MCCVGLCYKSDYRPVRYQVESTVYFNRLCLQYLRVVIHIQGYGLYTGETKSILLKPQLVKPSLGSDW